jgi:hypothetical protein
MIRSFGLMPYAALAWCAALAWGQRPSDADSAALLEKSRQKALDYSQSLPDFVCAEIIQRYAASAWGVKLGPWIYTDTLTVKLSYSQRTEGHKLELIDGKPTGRKFEDLGGETSSGEFGGILRTVFDPASQAAFDWDSSKKARNRRIAVYRYAVREARSPYYVRHRNTTGIVGLHGTVEIDSETGEVWRLVAMAYDIPQYLDVQFFSSTVEYALASVAGRNYLLPGRSETEIHSTETWARNKMEFRNYRKFSADSTIDFGTGK